MIEQPKFKIKYRKEQQPLLKSNFRVGVRPSKLMEFSKLQKIEEYSSLQVSFHFKKQQHIQEYGGIVTAKAEDVQLISQPLEPKKNIDVDEYPNCAVGIVKVTFEDSCQALSTGSLIGPRHVLTVAHSYYPNASKQQRKIEFIPSPIYARDAKGYNVRAKYVPSQILQIFKPAQFNKNGAFLFDYAVLELETDQNLQQYFGSFGYDFSQAHYQFQQTIFNMRILGYPEDTFAHQLVQYNGQAYVDKYYFLHNMPVVRGVSGGPFFCAEDEDYKILALQSKHIYRLINGFSASLKLSVEMFEDIQKKFTNTIIYYDAMELPCKSKVQLLQQSIQNLNEPTKSSNKQSQNKISTALNIEIKGCKERS